MKRSHLLFLSLAALACPIPAQLSWTQAADWHDRTPFAAPPDRRLGAMVATDGGIVLFAGQQPIGPPRTPWVNVSDTWVWDPFQESWADVTASGPVPPARNSHAMCWDATRGRIVMFGGSGATALSDTWEFANGQWSQSSPAASPPARFGHSMGFDPVLNRTVLYGGRAGTTYLGDTWTYDGVTWSQVASAGTPAGQFGATMVWDPDRQHLVLFGGASSSGLTNGLWEFVGSSWVLQTVTGSAPPARSHHGAAYDIYQHRLVVYGGISSAVPEVDFDDVWVRDGAQWQQVNTVGVPGAMARHCMAYLGFSGYSSNNQRLWNNTLMVFGSGRTWVLSVPPPPRHAHALGMNGIGDFDRTDLVVMGGAVSGGNDNGVWIRGHYGTFPYEVWERSQSSPIAASVQHAASAQAPAWFKLVGGATSTGQLLDTTLTGMNSDGGGGASSYNGYYARPPISPMSLGPLLHGAPLGFYVLQGFWCIGAPVMPGPLPSARYKSSMAYDPVHGRMVLFGGASLTGPSGLLADTVVLGQQSLNCLFPPAPPSSPWTVLATPHSPPGRMLHRIACDDIRGHVLLFGGEGSGGLLGDTWDFDGNDWIQLAPSTSPSARSQFCMTYDVARRVITLFGGTDATGPRGDLWDWTGFQWLQRSIAGAAPGPRWGADMVCNGSSLMLWGGRDGTTVFNDLWLLGAPVPGTSTVDPTTACGIPTPPTLEVAPSPSAPWWQPVLGYPFRLRLANFPAAAGMAFVTLSLDSGAPIQIPQLPGCRFKTNWFNAWPVTAANGEAFFVINLPATPSLQGLPVWFQGIVPETGANALDLAFTGIEQGILGFW